MKKLLAALWVLFLVSLPALDANAQATQAPTAAQVACPASGSSIQVLAAAASRESYLVSNTSGVTVKVGFLASGTATLTTSNSIQLLAGQTLQDAAPSIYLGRIVCMSSDATPRSIEVVETRR